MVISNGDSRLNLDLAVYIQCGYLNNIIFTKCRTRGLLPIELEIHIMANFIINHKISNRIILIIKVRKTNLL